MTLPVTDSSGAPDPLPPTGKQADDIAEPNAKTLTPDQEQELAQLFESFQQQIDTAAPPWPFPGHGQKTTWS